MIDKKFLSKRFLQNIVSKWDTNLSVKFEYFSFENYVYLLSLNNRNFILRLMHKKYKCQSEMQGEIDFIISLLKNGICVSKPIRSQSMKYIEKISFDGSMFYALVFEMATGFHAIKNESVFFSKEYIISLGRLIGKLHNVSRNFIKPINRKEWHEEDLITNANKYLKRETKDYLEMRDFFLDFFDKVQIEKDNYGLIHGDLHPWNMKVHDKDITIFDFDECHYNWFAYDLSVVMFFYSWTIDTKYIKNRNHISKDQILFYLIKGYKNTIN